MAGKLQIRNSTVDFLVFTRDAKESGIEVRIQEIRASERRFYLKITDILC